MSPPYPCSMSTTTKSYPARPDISAMRGEKEQRNMPYRVSPFWSRDFRVGCFKASIASAASIGRSDAEVEDRIGDKDLKVL